MSLCVPTCPYIGPRPVMRISNWNSTSHIGWSVLVPYQLLTGWPHRVRNLGAGGRLNFAYDWNAVCGCCERDVLHALGILCRSGFLPGLTQPPKRTHGLVTVSSQIGQIGTSRILSCSHSWCLRTCAHVHMHTCTKACMCTRQYLRMRCSVGMVIMTLKAVAARSSAARMAHAARAALISSK